MGKVTEYLGDFAAGVDPTGVRTFRRASRYEKDHGKHRAAGNVGGVVGGALVSLGATALGAKGLSKVYQKSNPRVAENFSSLAKNTLLPITNPKKAWEMIKRFPKSSRISLGLMRTPGKIDELTKTRRITTHHVPKSRKYDADTTTIVTKGRDRGAKLSKAERKKLRKSKAEAVMSRTKVVDNDPTKIINETKLLAKRRREYMKQYKSDPVKDFTVGSAVIGGGVTAGIGGGLNAFSAHGQYNVAQELKKKKKPMTKAAHVFSNLIKEI